MNLGLYPGIGGGLKTTANDGQVDRLIAYYFHTYSQHFKHIYYFSYHHDVLKTYTDDATLLQQITVVPRLREMPHRLYALQLPRLTRTQLQDCDVLRVFQARGALPAMLARLRYGLPYATTYGYNYAEFSKLEGNHLAALMHRLTEPLLLRLAAAVIVTTPSLQRYVSRYLPAANIHLIPNGVDSQLFAPALPSTKLDQPATILFVGRLKEQKNLPRLLQAVSQLNLPIRVKLIGEGPQRERLQSLAHSLQVDCHFLGNLPHHELPHHYQTATLFALPSLIEGHPKVLIEAMSCGLPCVVSNSEGNRLLITHEQTGLMHEPDDTHTLAQQIKTIIENPQLAQRLGQQARQYIVKHLDVRQLLAQEVILLQNISR